MAINYIDRVLRGIRTVSPVEKLIMVILADYSRAPGGESWPSVATIAWEACIGRRQATEHLARLRQAGWIEVIGSARGGRGKSTRYKLNLSRIYTCADDAKNLRDAAKRAATRAVFEQRNNADVRTVSASETARSSTPKHADREVNHAESSRESMRLAAHKPLNLAVTTSTFLSRTSKPIEKVLDQNPETPNGKPAASLYLADDPTPEQIQAREAEKARVRQVVDRLIAKG